jgi:ABC-type molybdate transport system substrate-binding protein
VLAVVGSAILGAACAGTAADQGVELTVFGAASLRDVLVAAEGAYETAHPGSSTVWRAGLYSETTYF